MRPPSLVRTAPSARSSLLLAISLGLVSLVGGLTGCNRRELLTDAAVPDGGVDPNDWDGGTDAPVESVGLHPAQRAVAAANSRPMRPPPMIAVYKPCSGRAPEAMAKAMASGSATMPTMRAPTTSTPRRNGRHRRAGASRPACAIRA